MSKFINRENYIWYLENVIMALLSERSKSGNESDTVLGKDLDNHPVSYSVYNIKQAIVNN